MKNGMVHPDYMLAHKSYFHDKTCHIIYRFTRNVVIFKINDSIQKNFIREKIENGLWSQTLVVKWLPVDGQK